MNHAHQFTLSDAARAADPRDGFYSNPIIAGDYPDPSVLRDGDAYYLVASSFVYYPGLVVWRSTDLVTWSPIGPALTVPLGSVYAPEIVKHEGRFYIYAAVRAVPQMPAPDGAPRPPIATYVVHADQIEGPWSEPIDLGIHNAIDPGHAVGEDGKRYLYVSDGTLIPLADDGLSRVGPDERLYDGWDYPADWEVETFALEGAKIIRRDGWFYMFSAEGGTAGPPTSHMVVVARSRSISGPWENCPHNPIIRTRSAAEPWWSRGHGTPLEDSSGAWWMIYHGYKNGFRALGRQPLLEPMEWTADGWPLATGGDLSEPLHAPNGPRSDGGLPGSGPIDERWFGPRMTFFKPGRGYLDRIRFDGESVTLQGQGGSPQDASPLVINTGDTAYEVSVELELVGPVTGGLILFYNEEFFCGIASDQERIRSYHLAAENPYEAPTPAIGRTLHLRLVNRGQVGSFYYSSDGMTWTLHRSYEVSGYHHNVAGKYLSLRPAFFAAGEGTLKMRSMNYTPLQSLEAPSPAS
ncbi:family 43 glycosylhydrolase [Sinomonas sp. P47F7]|uniref:family 43 glycosylhydrolase n=1 Tax=Sinomonas sp. P47F7 TaxID=3410987 RepID=UPI003BF5D282